MPIERPTLTELRGRVETDIEVALPGSDSRLRFGILNAIALAEAGLANGLYGYIDNRIKALFWDTATGADLDRLGSIWGLPRKVASAATGTATVTGTVGAVVPVGYTFARTGGATYTVTSEVTLSSSSATVALTADTPGLAGNATVGTTLQGVNPLVGINAAATVVTMTGGAETETDESYRLRGLERVQNPPGVGLLSDYRREVLSLPGVTRVWVGDQAEFGANSVIVRFAMDDTYPGGIPAPADVATVLAHLTNPVRKVVGAEVMVQAPVALAVNFNLNLAPNTSAVRTAVTEALAQLIRREGAPATVLPISAIREAISTAAGETDHVLNSPVANITPTASQLPTLGTVTFNTLS